MRHLQAGGARREGGSLLDVNPGRTDGRGGVEEGAMCLGVPGKVVAIQGLSATVDFFGVQKELRLDIVDEPVQVGDYVLNHVGFAIRRIPPEEVQETLALFDELLRGAAGPDDLMAADVRGEIAAGKEKE
jgi:hydrogenase expression/formation protein HypC